MEAVVKLQLETIRFCMRLLNHYAGAEGDRAVQAALASLQTAARERAERIRQDAQGVRH